MTIGERYTGILDAAAEVFARRGFHVASIRDIARASKLSLAGLYHYVGGKDELLFLVLDRALVALIGMQDEAVAEAPDAEARLHALIRTHLQFGFERPAELRLINRDWDLLEGPRREEIATKRRRYIQRGLAILGALDTRHRSSRELFSATTLLLGMLNGIAAPPFLRSRDDARRLAAEVGGLFLHGFLEHGPVEAGATALIGGAHDA